MYYNLYILSSIYFEYSITTLYSKEEQNLKGIYVELILRKIGFSSTFPRFIMHMSKEMLGLGLFLPKTIISIQGL